MDELNKICNKIVNIFEGICMGSISVFNDPLNQIMGQCSPQEVLDSIISDVGFKVMSNVMPSNEEILKLQSDLRSFRNSYKCNALDEAIDDIDKYIEENIG